MKNRYTPFGYCVQNGAVTIVLTEADVVRQIFSEYLSGQSLENIAAKLTAQRVEYLPLKWQWNKNRVVRIINDKRYLGNEIYDAIIDEGTFSQAQITKLSRNTQPQYNRDKVISPSVAEIVCAKCGCSTKRIHDNRSKFNQKYMCTNTECRAEYKISNNDMIQMIAELFEKANLTLSEKADVSELLEIHRLEQEIARAVEYADTDVEKARSMIFDCANIKYQTASKGRAEFDKLKLNLNNADLKISRQTVMKLVSQIKLVSDEKIEVTLINGQVLRKESQDGTGYSES